jgi:hypothetical protein
MCPADLYRKLEHSLLVKKSLRISFLLLLLLQAFSSAAQTRTLYITGFVTDSETKKPVSDVAIKVVNGNSGTYSDKLGFYLFNTQRRSLAIEFTKTGYTKVTRRITVAQLDASGDTISLDIKMKPGIELEEVTISATQKADTVFGTHRFSIMDFEFHRDKFLFLVKDKSGWKVMLAGDDRKEIAQVQIPKEAAEPLDLYKDFLGNVNVICKDYIYRVMMKENEKLVLGSLPVDDFNSMIRPCIDTVSMKIFFSNYSPSYPNFSYYAFNRPDSSSKEIRNIIDKPLQELHDFEYDFMKPRDKLTARQIAQELKLDKRDVAAALTDFGHSKYFTPLYAPLFIRKDTILVFDHYSNALFKYDPTGTLLDSLHIDYHKPKNWKEWERQLVEDESNGDIYALYLKGGFYYLKHIDLATGKVNGNYKLTQTYVEHIHVRDGYVYYIYRPFESMQKKFLYKERIM